MSTVIQSIQRWSMRKLLHFRKAKFFASPRGGETVLNRLTPEVLPEISAGPAILRRARPSVLVHRLAYLLPSGGSAKGASCSLIFALSPTTTIVICSGLMYWTAIRCTSAGVTAFTFCTYVFR
jgi:hypothetical protein